MLTNCKNCSAKLRLPDGYDGQPLRCPHCEIDFTPEDDPQPVAECEHCWVEYQVKASLMGERLKCPSCQKITRIIPKSPRLPVVCDSCQSTLSVPQKMVGWTIRCHVCESTIRVLEKEADDFLKFKEEHAGDYYVVNEIDDLTKPSRVRAQSSSKDDQEKPTSEGQNDQRYQPKLMPVMNRDLNLKAKPNPRQAKTKPAQPLTVKPVADPPATESIPASQSRIIDLTPEVYRSDDLAPNAPRLVVRAKAPSPPASAPSSRSGSNQTGTEFASVSSRSSASLRATPADSGPDFSGPQPPEDSGGFSDSDIDFSGVGDIETTRLPEESDDSALSFVEAQEVASSSSAKQSSARFKVAPKAKVETLADTGDTQAIETAYAPTPRPAAASDTPARPAPVVPPAPSKAELASEASGYVKKRDSQFQNTLIRVIAGAVAIVAAAGGFYLFSNYIAESRKDRGDRGIQRININESATAESARTSSD